MINVFLVPVGADRHDLYCEIPLEDLTPTAEADAAAAPPWWRKRLYRFQHLLAQAEDERRRRELGETVESSGLWRWVMRKIAESVAEQRLLWILRRLSAAALVHPADQSAERALEITRTALRRDFEKHRRWLVIDTLLMVLCLPLTIIPGPNVPSLYFFFRAIGHYLAWRGARSGIGLVAWEPRASTELTEVRAALTLPPAARRQRVDALAAALGLERLGPFVDRVTG